MKELKKLRGVYERPRRSGHWWIRYADEFGREHREAIGPHGLALKMYNVRKAEVAERRHLPRAARRTDILMRDAIKAHVKRQLAALRSTGDLPRYGRIWTNVLGNKPLRAVTPSEIEAYIRERQDQVSQQTLAHEVAFLRRLFNIARRDGLTDTNPAQGLARPPRSNRVRFLSDEEEKALSEALDQVGRKLLVFAVHTGLRRGEQFGLGWDHVNMKLRVLRLPRSKTEAPRTVALNDTALRVLRSMPRRLKCPWVFPNETGKNHVDAHNFINRVFVPAVRKAKITDFRWHDLRHTFASRLAMRGVELRTIGELMGHKTIQMTMRYAHLAPGYLSDAVRTLDKPAKGRGGTGTKTGTNAGDKK